MPRNSSGTYSLYTPGNPVVTNTVISSTWANNTLADLASALTDSLSRSGDGGMQAPLELDNGAVGAPGLSWAAETTSGLYRASAGNFRFSVSSSDVVTITSAGLAVTGTLSSSGAATLNSLGVTGNATVGGTLGVTGNTTLGGTLAVTGTISGSNFTGFANPSASAGLTAVNGSATTAMRSDAAPAISQSITPTWTGIHAFSCTTSPQIQVSNASVNSTIEITTSGVQNWAIVNQRSTGNLMLSSATDDSSPRLTITALGGLFTSGATGGSQGAGTLNATGIYDDGLQIFPNVPRSTTTTTLVASDLGKCVAVSAAIAIPASVFSAGDAISIYNDSGSAVNITIAAGTLRLAGTATTGTRSLAARGLATLWFNVGGATPEVIASGSVT